MSKKNVLRALAVFAVVLLLIVPLGMAQGNSGNSNGNGNSSGGGDNQTAVSININPPSTGGGAIIKTVEVSNLQFDVSADSPSSDETVTLVVNVDTAVSGISVSAAFANKNHLKIKWYNLLENGHFTIGDMTGSGGKGSAWDYGTVWKSTTQGVMSGEHTISIPVTFDLTAGGTVNPRDIPVGSTKGNATIIWTLVINTM